jgi:hypothetical protein
MPAPKKTSNPRDVGLREGFRSGLEELIAKAIEELGHEVRFEQDTVHYTKPERRAKYTPDFVLENGIVIETKGRFVTADRQKHLLVQDQHPDLDIRFIFSNPNTRISKLSSTTYAMWCDKHGFLYTKRHLPRSWLDEPKDDRRIQALTKARQK